MKVHAAIPLQKKTIAILGHMHRDTGSNKSVLDSFWQACHCSATCCLRPITQKKKVKFIFSKKNLKPGAGEGGTTGDDTRHIKWIKAPLLPSWCPPILCWLGLLSPAWPCPGVLLVTLSSLQCLTPPSTSLFHTSIFITSLIKS